MEIKIRNIDSEIIRKIDEMKPQDMSRNEYLVKVLEHHAALDIFKDYQYQYEEVVKQALKVIRQNSEIMREFVNVVSGDMGGADDE